MAQRVAGITGDVTVRIVIEPSGRVRSKDVERSSGNPYLDYLAIDAVPKRFPRFHAEMEHTPVDDDTADILISNCVINLAPDKDAVFREAFRVLKPGGRLMVSDMVLVEALPEEQAADTANWVACLAGAELKQVYLSRIADAGFADVEVVSETDLENSDGWRSGVRSMNIKATKPAS